MKHTLASDTTLFAKELNLDPKDYKLGEIIDIAIKTIKSSDNPLVMERIETCKKAMENAFLKLKPALKKAKEDKPGYQYLLKLKNKMNEDNFDYDIQDLLKQIEKDAKESRIKDNTKPTGQNKSITKRNDKIRIEYYKLKQKGKTMKKACNVLGSKYNLSSETIKTYIKN